MSRCGACFAEGYIRNTDGSINKCHVCDGFGVRDTDNPSYFSPNLVSALWHEVDRLQKSINGHVREAAKFKRDTSHDGMHCRSCHGHGFLTPAGDMIKCNVCDGQGSPGKDDPVIGRLWHEIYMLRMRLQKADEDSRTHHHRRRPPPPPPKPSIDIKENDVWLHILGLNGEVTAEAVKKAYKQTAFKHHPDQGGTARDFRMVQLAYDKLLASIGDPA